MPHRPLLTGLSTVLALAGSMFAAAPAGAADLDFPTGYGEAPQAILPETKVEFGTG